jgi:rhodanese-related sulfurtransferase
VVVADPGREVEAVQRLGRIGFDSIVGYLAGGIDRARHTRQALDRVDRVDADSLVQKLTRADRPVLIDVRSPTEWEQGRIEHAVHIPLSRLGERLEELPTDRPIVVYCATGYRSAIAASLLRRAGFSGVASLAGGLAAQATLVRSPRPGSATTPVSDQAVPGGQCDGGRA